MSSKHIRITSEEIIFNMMRELDEKLKECDINEIYSPDITIVKEFYYMDRSFEPTKIEILKNTKTNKYYSLSYDCWEIGTKCYKGKINFKVDKENIYSILELFR